MKILDNFINQHFGAVLCVFVVMFICMFIFGYAIPNYESTDINYTLQHGEIINSSMCVSFQPSTSIPLPENNCTYHIYISTTMRGQHDVYVGYSYISYEIIYDKFGSYKQSIYHGAYGDYVTPVMDGYLGVTNDNAIVDSIFTIPPDVDKPIVVMNTVSNDYASVVRVVITKL